MKSESIDLQRGLYLSLERFVAVFSWWMQETTSWLGITTAPNESVALSLARVGNAINRLASKPADKNEDFI